MEKVFGPLGAMSVIVGCLTMFDALTGSGNLLESIALIASGLSLLAVYEVIKVMKQIRDKLPAADQS